ncbi:hypothetical protein HYDPIDRAFT_88958 [Hydnomerulius pinastri MD-312]|uniref:Uncharacterized protein n=1 Tax=Hydnomerulius pinastri MD-312 TaxID=994086 RepID=A0A0C9W2M3_9AGAM|nr:hypothetical protein HYDPIDRAFT_88958 [Hydnomerulius pinastri MD-312]
MSSSNLRQPDPAYKDRNGFREHSALLDKDHPDDVTLRNHRFAQYILTQKGHYLPSPDALRELGATKSQPVETIDSINEKIKDLQEQHVRDLENLFAFQAAEYRQEMRDHQACYDDSAYMDIDASYPDQVAFRDALEDLEKEMRQMGRFKRDMDDGLSMLRYTHLKTLTQLNAKRNALRIRESQARKDRDAQFPQTIEEYHQITDRDVELRVARFLTSTATEQEKMMDEFGWPYRYVQPLLTIYKSNVGPLSAIRLFMTISEQLGTFSGGIQR